MAFKLIVIGGTAAGLSAASKAKRIDPTIEITVYEQSGYVSYGACGLPYYIGDLIKEADDLISLTPEVLSKKRGIPTFTHHRVLEINPEKKCVTVKNLNSGETFEDNYDKLLIATGAKPIIPNIEGIGLKGIHYLRQVEDGIAIKSEINSEKIKKIGIIGGGFIGLELAEQIREIGKDVVLFEALPRLLPMLSEEDSEAVYNTLIKNGVDVKLGAQVIKFHNNGDEVCAVELKNADTIPLDLVIVSVGVSPNTDIAKHAGIELGLKGGIVVDKLQQTNIPDIYAAGDCVQMNHIITDTPCYIPLGTTANKQGRIAGGNIAGETDSFDGVLGSSVTKVFDMYIATTGLSATQAKDAGFEVAVDTVIKGDKASYYPGSQDNKLTLVFDSNNGRILGAQGIGSESVAGRINVFVTAITSRMTIDEINRLDLVYSPPVAPVYDPILIAASQALKKVKV